jgi:hypothetical protein
MRASFYPDDGSLLMRYSITQLRLWLAERIELNETERFCRATLLHQLAWAKSVSTSVFGVFVVEVPR